MSKFNEISQKESGSFHRYFGMGGLKIVAVNPTRKELCELQGRDYTPDMKEIDYTTTNEKRGNGLRVDFIVKFSDEQLAAQPELSTDWNDKLSFWVYSTERPLSSTGKYQWVDAQGSFYWSVDGSPTSSFVTGDSPRRALWDEEQFLDAIYTYCAFDKSIKVEDMKVKYNELFDMKKLVDTGDVSEVRECLAAFTENTGLKALLYIKTGTKSDGSRAYYQNIYSGKVFRFKANKLDRFISSLSGSEYALFEKSDVCTPFSLNVQEFDPSKLGEAPAAAAPKAASYFGS